MGLKVYIAGPISKGNVVVNIRTAIDVAEIVRQQGHFPFVPHLTTFTWYFAHIDKLSLDDSSWAAWNLAWLDCCDAVIRLPGLSSGSDKEVEHAEKLNKPVFYGLDQFKHSAMWKVK